MKHFGIIGLCLLTALTSGAVSRVGGGKISSQSSGFVLDFDPKYKLSSITDGVRAIGDSAFIPGFGVTSSFFEITEFAKEYPQFVSLTREDLRAQMITMGWEEVPSKYPCALAISKASNNVIAIFVTWGKGKGLVIKGLNSWNASKALSDSLKTLELTDGTCSWK